MNHPEVDEQLPDIIGMGDKRPVRLVRGGEPVARPLGDDDLDPLPPGGLDHLRGHKHPGSGGAVHQHHVSPDPVVMVTRLGGGQPLDQGVLVVDPCPVDLVAHGAPPFEGKGASLLIRENQMLLQIIPQGHLTLQAGLKDLPDSAGRLIKEEMDVEENERKKNRRNTKERNEDGKN